MAVDPPARPWAVWLGDELYGDFRTAEDQARAVTEAVQAGEPVANSRWDPDKWGGPGWTEPAPMTELEADRGAEAGQ
jgi:hypothetical protein